MKKKQAIQVKDARIYKRFRKSLLTEEALDFNLKLQRMFRRRWQEIQLGTKLLEDQISSGKVKEISFRQDAESCLIRDSKWYISDKALNRSALKQGIILVSPASPEMIVKAQTTQRRYGMRPVGNMIDFEDAYHLDFEKVLEGQLALKKLKEGYLKVGKYVFDRNCGDKANITRIRINGFDAPAVEEILVDDEPIERGLFDFGLHFYHNVQSKITIQVGPRYVLPKMEYERALLWRDIFRFAETELNVPPKTIKASIIDETVKGDFELNEMIFVLSDGQLEDINKLKRGEIVVFNSTWVERINSGRYDRIFSAIKTFRMNPNKVFPTDEEIALNDKSIKSSWEMISETAYERNIIPIGGMIVALTSDPATRDAAISVTVDALTKQHEKGSVQAWEAMPDTTDIANKILKAPIDKKAIPSHYTKVRNLKRYTAKFAKMRDIEAADAINLNSTPIGSITRKDAYASVHRAIEYMEGWLRGKGVVSYRSPFATFDTPLMMQNVATTEVARSKLWTWLHHNKRFNDDNTEFTKTEFERLCNQVLHDIKIAIESGHPAKGKMSVARFKDGYYQQAADILKEVVESDEFIPAITHKLYKKYKELH